MGYAQRNMTRIALICHFLVDHSKGLADNSVVAKVNGALWDLDRPLEEDSTVELLNFNDEDGTIWCSLCHL